MVTAGTYDKQHLFCDTPRLNLLHNALLSITDKYGWQLQAWAVLSNHYHFIAAAPEDPQTLSTCVRELHSRTAIALNKHDNTPGRKIWHNYWESLITHQHSYFARLNYVHHNAQKHGCVTSANQYPWCSAAWFEGTASAAQIKTIYGFKTDRLTIQDDY